MIKKIFRYEKIIWPKYFIYLSTFLPNLRLLRPLSLTNQSKQSKAFYISIYRIITNFPDDVTGTLNNINPFIYLGCLTCNCSSYLKNIWNFFPDFILVEGNFLICCISCFYNWLLCLFSFFLHFCPDDFSWKGFHTGFFFHF